MSQVAVLPALEHLRTNRLETGTTLDKIGLERSIRLHKRIPGRAPNYRWVSPTDAFIRWLLK